MQPNIEALWHQIELLDSENQQIILARIQQSLQSGASEPKKPSFRMTDLKGAGRGIYTDPNADEATRAGQIDDYIRKERDSWER